MEDSNNIRVDSADDNEKIDPSRRSVETESQMELTQEAEQLDDLSMRGTRHGAIDLRYNGGGERGGLVLEGG